ncbi:MAG: MFS transporter [Streptomycetaceae bacterium]|nr:MFS transporter [Streptomycetaceae bacterium]
MNALARSPERETSAKTPPPPRAKLGARYALMVFSLVWAAHLTALLGILAGNAQSKIALHFHTTDIVWFTLTASLVGTFVTPFVVKFAGMYGKKRVMVVVAVFGLAGDLIAALATSFGMLLVGRGIAGVYLAAGPIAYALTRDIFPKHLVGSATGLLGGSVGLVAIGGPFLTGWLLDDFGFRGALWFMVIGAAVALAALVLFVPESPVREPRTRIDWLGGLLVGGGLTAIVYGLDKGADWGWRDGSTLAFLGGGVAALVAFVVVETKVAHPMFPMALLTRRPVWTTLLAGSLAQASAFSLGTFMYLMALMPSIPGVSAGLGYSATHNAVVNAPNSAVVLLSAVAAGTLARRFDGRKVLSCGALVFAVGQLLTSQYHHTEGQLIAVGVVGGVGMGIIVSTVPVLVIEAVDPSEQALGSGALSMLAGVVGAVITQVVFTVMADDGKVMRGVEFYRDEAFRHAFLIVAGIGVVAALLALLIPKPKPLDEVEAGEAAA